MTVNEEQKSFYVLHMVVWLQENSDSIIWSIGDYFSGLHMEVLQIILVIFSGD